MDINERKHQSAGLTIAVHVGSEVQFSSVY